MQLHQLIDLATAEIQRIYLRDSIPWIVGCSWGKDSSCALQLIWQAISKLKPNQRYKKVSVITTNTGVENPLIDYYCSSSIKLLNHASQEQNMPFKAILLEPKLENSFWVLTIGRGYSKPSHRHRWCTPRLKIEPSDRYIREQVSRYGESILVLGVRKDESIKRKASIEKHQQNALEPNLSPSASLINSTIYTPIVDWTTTQVWQYLLQVDNPWSGDNQELFRLYRGATDSTECPLVVEENTASCGKSRFGCYVCTVAQSEHSLTNTINNDEQMEWLEPLLDLREQLAQSKKSDRGLRTTARGVQFHQNHVNSQINLEPTPGKYNQKFRASLLKKLLQAQKDINQNAPAKYQGISLISPEELSEIRYLWLHQHHEIEDLLPQIYQEINGEDYREINPDRIENKVDLDPWQALTEICEPEEARLIASLLSVTKEHQIHHRRNQRYKALTKCIQKNMYSQAESIYHGYQCKCAADFNLPDSIQFYIKLMARTIPKDKILKFQ